MLKNVIVPVVEEYPKVQTIQNNMVIKIKCYYSPKFTSTLLSDNNVLEVLPMNKDYDGQLMLKIL